MVQEVLNALGVRALQIAIQLVGFLIVFGLLGKLLWKPLLGLMDAREKEVKEALEKATEADKKAAQLEVDFDKRLKEVNAEVQKKLLEGEQRVEAEAKAIMDDAHQVAEEVIKKAERAAQEEFMKAKVNLRDFAANLSLEIAEKVLGEQVDKAKHEALVKQFLSDMENQN